MKPQKNIESAPNISSAPENTGTGEVLAGVDGQMEKISEVVGEKANEQGGNGGNQKQQQINNTTQNKKISFKKLKKDKVLPPPDKQKRELKKEIEKKTHKLIAQALKMQNSKDFEPDKLENMIQEIRYLRRILAEIISATVDRVSELYKKYIWKE